MNNIQHNGILGVLLGVAVGDALGAPVEFMSAEEIKSKHGRITQMIGGGWLDVRPGDTTDDTDMTLCVARGIVSEPEDPIAAIGAEFIRWANSNPKDIGGTCALSISQAYLRGSNKPTSSQWEYSAYEAHEAMNGRSAGNGSLMRTAYIPCFYYDNSTIESIAASVSKMTHFDPIAAEACAVYCSIIGRMLSKRERYSRYEIFRNEIRHTMFADALEPAFKPNPTGYVVDSFKAAIWSVQRGTSLDSTDFRKTLETAVNLGGDADTIGAITGGLAGAICGANRIPGSWLAALTNSVKEEIFELSLTAEIHREREKKSVRG